MTLENTNWRDLFTRGLAAITAIVIGSLLVALVAWLTNMSIVEVFVGVPEPTELSKEQIRGGLFGFRVAAVVVVGGFGAWWFISWLNSRGEHG